MTIEGPGFDDAFRTRGNLEVICDTHRVCTNPEVKMVGFMGVGFNHVEMDRLQFLFRFSRKMLNELLASSTMLTTPFYIF